MKTGIITTNTFLNHNTGLGHPERADRVSVIIDNLKKFEKKLIWKKPITFDKKFLKITHSSKYINMVEDSFPKKGFSYLDGDTVVSPGSKEATFDAVGSIISAIDGVINKDFKNAFCAVRPPGHHSEQEKAMGFCIFNNVAVGANYLIDKYKYKKIAIIDFDVHNGNGTQNIVKSNFDIAYVSIHQFPFYPGTGSQIEKGDFNNVLNIPVPSGFGSKEYKQIFDEQVFPFSQNFCPDILIISAGFDAHRNDPLAEINLEAEDFAYMAKRCQEIQPNLLLGLEGGYSLGALEECVVGVCEELM